MNNQSLAFIESRTNLSNGKSELIMGKIVSALIGPELLWVVFYLIVTLIIQSTGSPVKSMDNFWIRMAYIVPFVLIPLTIVLYYFPFTLKTGLLVRIWLTGLVGGHFVLEKSLTAHSEQGPGVGTAYIMGMIFAFVALIAVTIFVLIKFR